MIKNVYCLKLWRIFNHIKPKQIFCFVGHLLKKFLLDFFMRTIDLLQFLFFLILKFLNDWINFIPLSATSISHLGQLLSRPKWYTVYIYYMKKLLFDILYFIYYKLKNIITKKNRYWINFIYLYNKKGKKKKRRNTLKNNNT